MKTDERRLIDDCFLTDKERPRHDEALAILRERLGRVQLAGAAAVLTGAAMLAGG